MRVSVIDSTPQDTVVLDENFFRSHITFTSVAQIAEISRPLKSIGFSYFTFDRHYSDGSRVCLTNAGKWIDHYWRSGLYKAAVFEKDPMNFFNGYVFWSWLNREPIYSAACAHDIDHGITITEPSNKYSDFFHFVNHRKNNVSYEDVISVMDYLHRFIASFKQKMRGVINAAVTQKKAFPSYKREIQRISGSDLNEVLNQGSLAEFLSSTEITRLYLGEKFNNAYLTRKEICVIAALSRGQSYQLASDVIELSRSTFDYHISNIKKKLNCKTMFQLGCQIGALSERNIYPFKIH